MSSYSGYLLASLSGRTFYTKDIDGPASDGTMRMSYIGPGFGISRWDEFTFHSPIPLAEEPEGHPEYIYQVFVVRGFSKLLVLAPRRRIVDSVVIKIIDRRIFPNLRRVNIYLHDLIAHCQSNEAEFLITSLHGRTAAASTSLRSISLYGDDVTSSSLYHAHHELFNFHSVGVGRRLFQGLPRLRSGEDGEILRLSNDGFITLNLSNRHRAREVLKVIDFVFTNRWVEDWVPLGKGESL